MYPIKYRLNMGPRRDLTLAEAVAEVRGNRDRGYLYGNYVTVMAVYDTREEYTLSDNTVRVHEPGEPVFGLDVNVNPRDQRFGNVIVPAKISWGSIGAQDADTALFYARLLQHAALIAEMANAGPDEDEETQV